MEESKIMKFDITVLPNFLWYLASRGFLDFIDFLSVFVCIWITFWLIYFTFVADFIDIVFYVTFKYVKRFMWLYRILKIEKLLQRIDAFLDVSAHNYPQETRNSPFNETVENFIETNVLSVSRSAKQPSESSTGTPLSLKNKRSPRVIDFTAESSRAGANFRGNSLVPEDNMAEKHKSCTENIISSPKQIVTYIPEGNVVSSPGVNLVSSPAENLVSSLTKDLVPSSPETVSSIPTQNILSPEEKCESDIFTSSEQKFSLKQVFTWNLNKIRDLFKNENEDNMSSAPIKVTWENLAAEVTQVQPTGKEDKESLISSSNDSPVNVGCCNSLFMRFKPKLQMTEMVPSSMSYSQF